MKSIVLVLYALCSSAAADVIVVDKTGGLPGSVDSVQAGVDLALAGDTVLVVGSGTVTFQEAVVVDGKGITLISDGGETRVRTLRVSNLPASQRMVVRDVTVGLPGNAGQADIALRAVNCQGAVRLEHCRFVGDGGFAGTFTPFVVGHDGARGAAITNCADLVAVRCTFVGGTGATLEDEDFACSRRAAATAPSSRRAPPTSATARSSAAAGAR